MGKRAAAAAMKAEPPAAEYVAIARLLPWAKNPRKNAAAVEPVAQSMQHFGFGAPILARRANGEVIAGHTRILAAQRLGMARVPVRYLDLTEKQAHALALADNKLGEIAEWDDAALAAALAAMDPDLAALAGFDAAEVAALASAASDGAGPPPGPNMQERFGVPPFTVLDARQGYWQDRKRAWLAIGMQSEVGRGADLAFDPHPSDDDPAQPSRPERGEYNRRAKRGMQSGAGRGADLLALDGAIERLKAMRKRPPALESGAGRGNLNLKMSHPATTATINFYALKRKLERELGRKTTTPEARTILAGRGQIVDDRAVNRARKGTAP